MLYIFSKKKKNHVIHWKTKAAFGDLESKRNSYEQKHKLNLIAFFLCHVYSHALNILIFYSICKMKKNKNKNSTLSIIS